MHLPRLDPDSAKQGYNFLTPEIAKLAYRESVYREIGAVIEQERLWGNMLSSQPLCFNLFGGLKLDIEILVKTVMVVFRGSGAK